MGRLTGLVLLLPALLLPGSLPARESDFREYRAVQESLSRVPPKYRAEWLRVRGLDDSYYTTYRKPESTGLRLVGKWGRGPSVEVTGRDTLVALTLGSEVALLSFADPDSPVVLSEIQLDIIPRQSALYGSFLVTTNRAIEFWDITDPRAPVRRSSIPYTVGDFAIADSFLFFVCGDTFHAYSIGDPTHPRLLGRCLEGGYVRAATRNVAVVQTDVVDLIDVSDPAHPRRAGGIGIDALGIDVRGNLMCVTRWWNGLDEDDLWLDLVDISDPANPRVLSEIDDVGGFDIHIDGPFAFVSGFYYGIWQFAIVNIQDSLHPTLVSTCDTPGDNSGVWANWMSDYAYVADCYGLAVVDISDLSHPTVDTCIMKASNAVDVYVRDGRAYVADDLAGMKILDLSDPTRPQELGGIDTTNPQYSICEAVVASDSFAYMGWPNWVNLLTIDVSDPRHPVKVGGCDLFDWPTDMVLQDSLVYVSQPYRFQVVNVARPREPRLVGSCTLNGYHGDLALVDAFAYVSGRPLCVVNVARPNSPVLAGTLNRGVAGFDVVDTVMYAVGMYAQFWSVSISNPTAPMPLDSITLPGYDGEDVAVIGNVAYAGEHAIRTVDISDPRNLRFLGTVSVPGWTPRLVYVAPYLYACCYYGGVCIYETTQVGVAEEPERRQREPRFEVGPNPARGAIGVSYSLSRAGAVSVRLYDISGRELRTLADLRQEPGRYSVTWDGRDDSGRSVPAGIYFLRMQTENYRSQQKVVLAR